jgi:hypothetical protein
MYDDQVLAVAFLEVVTVPMSFTISSMRREMVFELPSVTDGTVKHIIKKEAGITYFLFTRSYL